MNGNKICVYGLKSETSKAYKNVETIAIELYEGDKKNTPEELIPFVTELFNQIGADRKSHVDEFHKIVLSRKTDQNLLPAPGGGVDSEVVLVGTDVGTSKEAKAAPKSESAAAKKYNI